MAAPRRPIYFGWYIVAIALVAQFISVGTQMFAAGVFLKPMTSDLGWSRESFSAVQTIAAGLGGVVAIFIGGILDRRGPRLLMLIGGALAGGMIIATAFVQEFWQFALLRGVGQTLGIALCSNLVVNVTVARWFVLRRGTAISIASLGISLGGVLLVPVVGWWMTEFGWRSSWVMLGITFWVLMLPAALLMRRAPEDMGLLPDGARDAASADPGPDAGKPRPIERQWTRQEAVRTPALWLIICGYGFATIGLGAFLLHVIPFLTDSGFSAGKAALFLSVFAWSSMLSKFIWGPLMDRLHPRLLSVIGFALAGIALAGLVPAATAESTVLTLAVLILYGFGMGGTAPLQETVWASYFGRMHLGSVRAVGMPFSIAFGALGPLIGGVLYGQTGDYAAAFTLFSASLWIGAILVLFARPPTPPADGEHPLAQPPLPATPANH